MGKTPVEEKSLGEKIKRIMFKPFYSKIDTLITKNKTLVVANISIFNEKTKVIEELKESKIASKQVSRNIQVENAKLLDENKVLEKQIEELEKVCLEKHKELKDNCLKEIKNLSDEHLRHVDIKDKEIKKLKNDLNIIKDELKLTIKTHSKDMVKLNEKNIKETRKVLKKEADKILKEGNKEIRQNGVRALSCSAVKEIKKLCFEGNLTNKQIAENFNISNSTISKIRTGKIYKKC